LELTELAIMCSDQDDEDDDDDDTDDLRKELAPF
jgi:hypothetical protein